MHPSLRATLGLIFLAACQRQPALATPASDQAVYAELYPERLRGIRNRFVEHEDEARGSFEALRRLPASAPPSLADELEQVVRRADAAGRSQPYVDEALLQEDVAAVMHDDRGGIRRRIAGSVTSVAKGVAKEKECLNGADIDLLAGAAAAGTDRAVERQLLSRLRAQNAAQAYLKAHTDELGPERVRGLERQVDALSRASFVAHVRLALYRQELAGLLEQSDSVRATLERDEAEGRAELRSGALSKSYRLALEERVAKDEAARAQLDSEVRASQAATEDMEARAQGLQRDFQALIESLLAELEQRQRPEPDAPRGKATGKGAARAGGRVGAPA